ncbi:hypothetical protein [Roseibium aggregatum]|uniref:Uncharacterized protein n=1 Tax=Roseibium aggregatum TaxID=187304 RepID=A0A926P486_9HYPH|nr:hypothetical protein [Roseibium aggregatum]MBD1549605.1 hypothetical protein [Roseibium aggregatum]
MRLDRHIPKVVAISAFLLLAATVSAEAVAYPHAEGARIMADWVLLAFIVFFGSALLVFLVAVRRGYFRNLENAKYYLLTIEEEDYYTPDWIKEAEADDQRQ